MEFFGGVMVDEIAKLIGFESALLFFDTFGGCRLYVPHADNLKPDNPIALVVGREAALVLCGEYGNASIRVPNLRQSKLDARNKKIVAARQTGASVNSLVMAFGLTYRQIGRICSASDVAYQFQARRIDSREMT